VARREIVLKYEQFPLSGAQLQRDASIFYWNDSSITARPYKARLARQPLNGPRPWALSGSLPVSLVPRRRGGPGNAQAVTVIDFEGFILDVRFSILFLFRNITTKLFPSLSSCVHLAPGLAIIYSSGQNSELSVVCGPIVEHFSPQRLV
jgi:hypothetical protein